MENQRKNLFFLFALLLSTLSVFAQKGPNAPALTSTPQGELTIVQSSETMVLYQNVKTLLSFQVLDRNNPCAEAKIIRLHSEDCKIEEKGKGSFYVQVPQKEATLTVYYETGEGTYEIDKVKLSCIPPKPEDPDFRSIYPNDSYKESISNSGNFMAIPGFVLKDDKYVLDHPSAMVQTIYRNKVNRIKATWHKGCEPSPEISVEGEGLLVENLDKWNEYNLIPNRDAKIIKVRFYQKEKGKKILLEEISYPVIDQTN